MTGGPPERGPVRPFTVALGASVGLGGELAALAGPPDPASLAERAGLLMISIKNRHFTTPLIDGFCRFVTERLRCGYVTVVDRPYVQNILATTDDGTHAIRIDGVRRLAEERTRQAERILRRRASSRVMFLSWDDLTERSPTWLTAEVQDAWQRRGLLHADLIALARERVGPDVDLAALERWALFLVEETPVLLYGYYLLDGGVVDVYPGPLPEYLWRIERGDYAAEIPRISALATSRQGLVYANVRAPIVEGGNGRPRGGDGHRVQPDRRTP
jgi:hypothetical protein